jgi:hypothetical protein
MDLSFRFRKILECRVDTLLFVCSLGLWIFFMVLARTSMFAGSLQGTLLKAVRCFCLATLLLSELRSGKYNFGSICFLLAVFLADTILVEQLSAVILDGLIFVYCGRNRSFHEMASVSLIALSLAFVAVVCASQIGLVVDYVEVTSWRQRHYLGFLYSLYPAMYVYALTCLWIYLREERLRVIEIVFLLIVNLIIYQLTVSRLSFYLSVVVVVGAAILQITKGRIILMNCIGAACVICFAVLAILAIAATAAYDPLNPLMAQLNSAFGDRLSLGQNALQTYGVSPFGQDVRFVGNGLLYDGVSKADGVYNYIDSLYVLLLVRYGWVSLLAFLSLMTFVVYFAWRQRDFYLVLLLVVLALHGLIDDLALYLYFNPFLLLGGKALATQAHMRLIGGSDIKATINEV